MKKKTNRKYGIIAAILLFVLYFASTIFAIWFNIKRKELTYSAVFAVLAIIFGFVFKLVIPRRIVTLYKLSDDTVKCFKCNKVAEDGKIYCKKHSAINKTVFIFKWLFLQFIVGIIYWFYNNYQEQVAIPEYLKENNSWSFIFPMTLTCIAILVPMYLYTRLGGRESTDSTALNITYIEAQKNKSSKDNYHVIKRNNEDLVSAEEPKTSEVFSWNYDDDYDDIHEDSSGKRNSKRGIKIAVTTVSVFLIISVGLNVFFFNKNQEAEKMLSEAQVEISENQKEIKDWKWEAEYEKKRADEAYNKYVLDLSYRALNSSFLYEYAACVNESDRYYHHPDCDYFDKSYFFIYNTDLAEAKGYRPCPDCW